MSVTAVFKAHPSGCPWHDNSMHKGWMKCQCTSMTTSPCLFLWLPDSYSPSHLSSCVWKGSRAAMTLPPLCCTLTTLLFGVADFLSSAHTDRRLWSVPSHSNAQQDLDNRTVTSLYSRGGRGLYINRPGWSPRVHIHMYTIHNCTFACIYGVQYVSILKVCKTLAKWETCFSAFR